MVEESHAYRFCSLSELSSNHAVELCGRGIPTDMVMYCNNVSCIVKYPESHDVSRVGSVFRHLSPADSDSSKQFMLRIEERYRQDRFVLPAKRKQFLFKKSVPFKNS